MSNPPKMVKLSEWAELNGINYQTAFRWFKAGKLPAKAIQTDTRTILVEVEDYDTSFDKAEAKMADDSLPLSARLHAAYKYIQKQKNERPEDIIDKKLGEQYGDILNSEDVSSKEKQEILKTMCGGYKPFEKIESITKLPNEIILLQDEKKQCLQSGNFERAQELIGIINEKKNNFYKEERFTILHKEQYRS